MGSKLPETIVLAIKVLIFGSGMYMSSRSGCTMHDWLQVARIAARGSHALALFDQCPTSVHLHLDNVVVSSIGHDSTHQYV